MASTSKPNSPFTPRAKRLASVFYKQGIRGHDQKTARTEMDMAMNTKILCDVTPFAHVALDVQQRC